MLGLIGLMNTKRSERLIAGFSRLTLSTSIDEQNDWEDLYTISTRGTVYVMDDFSMVSDILESTMVNLCLR